MRAEYEASWAGEFVYMCEKHMKQLVTIGTAMGVPVPYRVHSGDEICKNCERENIETLKNRQDEE